MHFDVSKIRQNFPFFTHHPECAYLDNGATTQKPQVVIDRIRHFYEAENASVHRGVYRLSEQASAAYEEVREVVRQFIGARSEKEIVFTSGATESINLIAQSFGHSQMQTGDNVILTQMEHHANIVPWQILRDHIGIEIRVLPISPEGTLLHETLAGLMDDRTKLIALTQVSNVLGVCNPVEEIIDIAHQHRIPVLLDGAQAVPHFPVNVAALDCDFYAFSAHKLFGPTGIGVLYGKAAWLDQLPPYQGGGDMIRAVRFSESLYAEIPHKFEAGTPNAAGVLGMGAAITYLQSLDWEALQAYEKHLMETALSALKDIPGLRLIGDPAERHGVISFVMDDVHAHDVGTILASQNIATRSGHHCAMPLMDFYGVPATTRASLAFYNTVEEIERLVTGIHKIQEIFH